MKFAYCFAVLLLLGANATDAFAADFPVQGKITTKSEMLRAVVRSGAGTEFKLIGTLPRGKIVQILAREGKWFKIAVPEDIPLYIPQQHVAVFEAGPEGTKKGKISYNRAELRSGLDPKDAVLGNALLGDKVEITGTKGSWYVIKGHFRAAAYISTALVEVTGDVGEPLKTPSEPGKPPARKPYKLDAGLKARLESAIDGGRFDEARRILNELENASRKAPAPERPTRAQVLAGWEARLEAAEEEYAKARRPAVNVKEFVGRIDDVGILLFTTPPGDFKLLKGNETVYYLKSVSLTLDLRKYLFQRVAVVGEVEKIEGWEEQLIKVTSLRILDVVDDPEGEGPQPEP
ncbi:MAG: SH3 domain-containing protein [Planctomycetota bacterium]